MSNELKGSYSEDIRWKKGRSGSLHVSSHDWYIFYMIPGPDRRYKIDSMHISSKELEMFLTAVSNAWNKFVEVKRRLGDMDYLEYIDHKWGISLCLGKYGSYVQVKGPDARLSTKEETQDFIKFFAQIPASAEKIQKILRDS